MMFYMADVTRRFRRFKWIIVGQQRHAVVRTETSGAMRTACGQLIHRSLLDTRLADAPNCYPCEVVTKAR